MREQDPIRQYIPLVDFLGKSLGESYEVLLYDLRDEQHPIVAISNGNISGRRVGSLMNQVFVKMIDNKASSSDLENRDVLIRHDAVSRDGKQFKSSSMLLRDDNGQPIGVLCINFLVDVFLQFNDFMKKLGIDLGKVQKIDPKDVIFAGEVFNDQPIISLEDLFQQVKQARPHWNFNVAGDRQELVSMFWERGGSTHRGAVGFLAEKLGISEPTVYRYIQNSRNSDLNE